MLTVPSQYLISSDNNGFCETFAGWSRSFGHFDRYFGSWCGPSKGVLRSSFPNWPLIGQEGSLHQRAKASEPDGADFAYHFDEEQVATIQSKRHDALNDYVHRIPYEIRSVVGYWEYHQWSLFQLTAEVPAFSDFLRSEITYGTQHYVLACLSLGSAASTNREGRREFARSVMMNKRHRVLAQLSGLEVPNSVWRYLRFFHKDALCNYPYRCLALLNIPSYRVLIKSLGSISTSDVFSMGNSEGAVVRARRPYVPKLAVGSRFKVLKSARDLKRESRSMRNCVKGYAADVREGQGLFLSWQGKERATVLFILVQGRYQLVEALGVANNRLLASSYAQLLRDLHQELPTLMEQ